MKRFLLSVGIMSLALVASGLSAAPADVAKVDRWGLTSEDYLNLRGADLRKKARVAERIADLEAASAKGNVKATALLASAYSTGTGVPTNGARSLELAMKAAEANLPYGLMLLGQIYRDGAGVPKDVNKAHALIEEAAAQGSVVAQISLADAYVGLGDLGVAKDAAKGISRLKELADNGSALAAYELSIAYLKDGATRDRARSYLYLDKAADAGLELAQRAVAIRDIQSELLKNIKGMVLWKHHGGLLMGNAGFGVPEGPCASSIALVNPNKKIYAFTRIVWPNVRLKRVDRTVIGLQGQIYMNDKPDGEFGFWINTNLQPEPKWPELFDEIELQIDKLQTECRAFSAS